ncbi:hypothetical protein FRC11_007874, partial [Ceratobasidium sp. 423]
TGDAKQEEHVDVKIVTPANDSVRLVVRVNQHLSEGSINITGGSHGVWWKVVKGPNDVMEKSPFTWEVVRANLGIEGSGGRCAWE